MSFFRFRRHRRSSCRRVLQVERLETRRPLAGDLAAQQIVINELHVNPDIATELVEFIELHNTAEVPLSVAGWFFGSGVEFTFPAGSEIPAGGYAVIAQNSAQFAAKFGFAPLGQWQGQLDNSGETLELYTDAGMLVDRVDYRTGFPWPTVGDAPGHSMELIHPSLDNELGGSWRASVGAPPVIDGGESWSYFKGLVEPSSAITAWRQPQFDSSQWLTGMTPIGYSSQIPVGTVLSDMRGKYSTLYLRKTFHVDDPGSVHGLILQTLYDDGVNVWINGRHVAMENVAGEDLAFDAMALTTRNQNTFVDLTLPDPAGYLVSGDNVIAVQVVNASLSSTDAYFDAQLINSSANKPGPTPGAANSVLADNAAPQLRQLTHTPQQPRTGDPVIVTIKATDPQGVQQLMLEYQVVDPGSYIRLTDPSYATQWASLQMHDDGQQGDQTANDAVFTAVIPGNVQAHRRLVRYRIAATDRLAESVTVPYADDPQPNFAYYVYDGVPEWTAANRPGSSAPVTFGQDRDESAARLPTDRQRDRRQ